MKKNSQEKRLITVNENSIFYKIKRFFKNLFNPRKTVENVLRVEEAVNIKSENKFTMVDREGNKLSMTKEELDKCIKLDSDALLCLMTATLDEDVRDVYACVHRTDDMRNGIKEPVMILRQNIYSSSKNAFNAGMDIYVGECLTNPKFDNDEQKALIKKYAESNIEFNFRHFLRKIGFEVKWGI